MLTCRREIPKPAGQARFHRLLGFFDFVGSVLFIFHLRFQVIDLFQIRFYILEHIIGFTASGSC